MRKMRMKKTLLTTLPIVSIVFGGNALAQQFILSGTELPPVQTSSNSIVANPASVGKLSNIGEPRGNLTPLKGFARDLPLLTVLKQITPSGWKVKKNDTPDRPLNVQQLVSWNGGQSWVNTLSELSQRYNFNTFVNWNTQEITLSPTVPVVIRKDEVRALPVQASNNLTPQNNGVFELGSSMPAPSAAKVDRVEVGSVGASLPPPGQAMQPTQVIAPVVVGNVEPISVAPPPSISWTLSSTKSLKENVMEWGEKAGYKVVWNGEDYPVDQNRSLSGEFDSENGPIRQLSLDYGPESRVQQPLAFQFFQNKTLVIEDFKFEQQGFPQYVQ